MGGFTYLSIVEGVDNFPYEKPDEFYEFRSHDEALLLGYVTPEIAQRLGAEQEINICKEKKTVKLAANLETFDRRNARLAEIATKWRKFPEFVDALDRGWRNELYAVYDSAHQPYFVLERAFSVLLGVVTYGVHITGFVAPQNSANGKLKIWVPRRSASKPTYPNMLDNTVAGGIGFGNSIWDTVVKESYEEAGLLELFVQLHSKNVDVVLYMHQPQGRSGNVQPEVEFIYDLEFDNESDVVPKPVDGESQDFKLMDLDQVIQRLENGEFKPNCTLVLINFLVRHGYINCTNESNYLEISARTHRKIPFPTL